MLRHLRARHDGIIPSKPVTLSALENLRVYPTSFETCRDKPSESRSSTAMCHIFMEARTFFLFIIVVGGWLTFVFGFSVTRAQLHQPASLPCFYKCSGTLTWIISGQKTIVATCSHQNQCSTKEGYELSYNNFLEGNLNLTCTSADHSKKYLYIADCNGQKVCECSLLIQAVNSSVVRMSGQAVFLDLLTMNPVIVTFQAKEESGYCTLNGRHIECPPKYKNRVKLLDNYLVLTAVSPLDTGFCTVEELEDRSLVSNLTLLVMGENEMKPDERKFVSQLEDKIFEDICMSSAMHITTDGVDALKNEVWKEGCGQGIKWTLAVIALAVFLGVILRTVFFK